LGEVFTVDGKGCEIDDAEVIYRGRRPDCRH